MKRLLYFFIKNNSLPIFFITCLTFIAWSIGIFSFSQPEFYPFRFINAAYAVFLLILCIFYNRINRMLAITLYLLAIFAYCIFTPILVQMICCTEFYLLCAIPALFLLTAEYKKPRGYYTVMNTLILVCLIFLLGYRITHTPPAKLFIAERRLFFMLTKHTAVILTTTFMTYAGFNALVILHHLEHKTDFLQTELEAMAKQDALTSLMNRRRATEVFTECEQRKMYDGTDFAICIFDIDNFKKINDTYGHDAGDFVLKAYSKAVRTSYEAPVEVARWGGEEFLIIFPVISETTVYELDRIRKRIAETPVQYAGSLISVTATYGISSSRNLAMASDVLADADHMLLDGKNNGKNRVVVSEKF